jgi:cold shock CspA family protein
VSGDDGKEYFFHRTGVLGPFNELEEGGAVTFEEEPSSKGPRATSVQLRDSVVV